MDDNIPIMLDSLNNNVKYDFLSRITNDVGDDENSNNFNY
jgi:hypothetical protein